MFAYTLDVGRSLVPPLLLWLTTSCLGTLKDFHAFFKVPALLLSIVQRTGAPNVAKYRSHPDIAGDFQISRIRVSLDSPDSLKVPYGVALALTVMLYGIF